MIEKLYTNLRYHFQHMYEHILGKDYYNMSLDAYSCDEIICRDIMRTYDDLKRENDHLAVSCHFMAGVILVLIVALVIALW